MKYRRASDGQLGEKVIRDGAEMIRIDRPNQELLYPFRKDEWIPEDEKREYTKHHVTRVAYEADRCLAMAQGDFKVGRKPWESLKDEERIKITRSGPATTNEDRLALWKHILAFKGFKGAR